MIAIVSALKDEVKEILSKIERDEVVNLKPATIYRGKYKGKEIILLISAVGVKPMKKAVDFLLRNFTPSLLIHIGYAGGTDPSLSVGDLVIAKEIREIDTDKTFVPDEGLKQKALSICQQKNLRFKEGSIVTVNTPLSSPHEKAFLGTQYESIAVDMESSGLAEVATGSKTPFLVVRSIFDPLEMPLPNFPAAVTDDGNIDVAELARHIYHNPKDLLNLPKFAYCANKAREAISTFIDAWLESG